MRDDKVWLSPSKTFAACFSILPYSNEGYYQGIDRVSANSPVVYLASPPGEKHRLSWPCSLYMMAPPLHWLCSAGIDTYEFVSFAEMPIVAEQEYRRAGDLLESMNIEFVSGSSTYCDDVGFAELCGQYKHGLEAFLGLPLDVALRLQCKRWALTCWLKARRVLPFEAEDFGFLERALERLWLPRIAATSRLTEYGYHGLHHLLDVAMLAARLALLEGGNPIAAALAGLFHDAGREGDEEGAEHAVNAVHVMRRLVGPRLAYLFTADDAQRIEYALRHHADGQCCDDATIGACWDADRLRLAWERGYQGKYFSTGTGRRHGSLPEAESRATLLRSAHLNRAKSNLSHNPITIRHLNDSCR